MTDKSSPDEPKLEPDLARFLQDWTELWRGELQAQSTDPEGLAAGVALWRATMTLWADAIAVPPVAPRDAAPQARAGTPRPQAAVAASDARDAAIERLVRRIDELEARLTKLETPAHRRG